SYDATLKGWAAQTGIPSGITLGASGLNYCSGAAARGELTGAAHSWTISDAGMGCPGPVTPGDPGNFITVWQAADGTIRIPTNLDYAYLYNIYWENVDDESINGHIENRDGFYMVSGLPPGTYRVEITGDFPAIYMAGITSSNVDQLLDVAQWGSNEWVTMRLAFAGTNKLVAFTAADKPDLSNLTDMEGMFRDASGFNGDIGDWDVSNVTNFNRMFDDASSFNQDIGDWDVRNVEDMNLMFRNATSVNQDLGDWNVSKVTDMGSMFS